MNIHDQSNYDLISAGLGSKSFQEFVDSYLANKYNGLKTLGFDWDSEIKIDYTYQQLEAERGIYSMSTYITPGAPSPVKSNQSFVVNYGTIPHNSHSYSLDDRTLRLQAMINKETSMVTQNMRNAIRDLLFDTTDKLIGGNYGTLTYQRDQMVSNHALTLTETNDPNGLKNVTFSANVPSANVKTLTTTARWFTDVNNTEGSASDPISNLLDMQLLMENKGVAAYHWEVDKLSLRRAFKHSKVLASIAMSLYPTMPLANASSAIGIMAYDAKLAALEGILGCPITVIDNVVAVEKFNNATGRVEPTQMRSFAADTWALVPDGQLGSIMSVQPILIGGTDANNIAEFDGGRTLLRRYYDIRTNVQYVQSDNASLVVPSVANRMFRIVTA